MIKNFYSKKIFYKIMALSFVIILTGISFVFAYNTPENIEFYPIQYKSFNSENYQKSPIISDLGFFTPPESQAINENKTIRLNIDDINQAFQQGKDSNTNINTNVAIKPKDMMKTIEDAFSIAPTVRDAFTPLEETRQGVSTIHDQPVPDIDLQEIDVYHATSEINVAKDKDTEQYASINPEQNISLEGKIISAIDIQGLNTIKPEVVLNQISTQIGSVFDSVALQQDLRNIYTTGYFTDIMAIEPTLREDGNVDLVFILQENILVSNVNIEGAHVIPSVELEQFTNSLKGLPQNLAEINKAIEGINNYYHEKGYILETIDSVDDDATGNLKFVINEGIINKINFVGNTKTKSYVIERNTMTKAGEVYNEELLKKDLVKIYATQIFEDVDREIKPSEENIGTYDVNVIVKEKVNNNVSIGGGIDSGLGVFGSVAIKENNFLGKAQKVSLSGLVGTGVLLSDSSITNRMNYQASLDFFEPYFLNADNTFAGKMYFRELGSYQVPLAIERRFGINGVIEHKVANYDNLTTSFATGIEHIKLREGDYSEISSMYNKRHLNIAEREKELHGGLFVNIAPGVRLNKLDNEECPREGLVAQARFIESLGIDHTDRTNGRLSGMVTRYFPMFKKSSLALTVKGGIRVHGNDMPEVMAYRLGGPYTIRGFKINGVGTGESFLMGSAELATPIPLIDKLKYDIFKKMRLAFFMDAGKVFQPTIASDLYDRPLGAISIGVGIRIPIPGIGPISIDYGLPLTNVGDSGSKGGYVTFGTGYMEGY